MKVLETRNYNIFKPVKGNRPVSVLHVNRLVRAMEEDDLHDYDPIFVNNNFEVIDGQHRLEARKIMQRPVYYVMTGTNGHAALDVVQKLNTNQKNWTNVDRLNSFIERGYENYKLIKDFMETFKFSLSQSIILLTLRGKDGENRHTNKDFLNGTFHIKDINMSVKYAKWILEFSKFYPGYTRRSFVCACMIMFSNKEYDHKRMMDKLEYLSKKICNCPDAVTYLKLLEELYNKHQSVGTRVRFV